jgi:hypothetical protein
LLTTWAAELGLGRLQFYFNTRPCSTDFFGPFFIFLIHCFSGVFVLKRGVFSVEHRGLVVPPHQLLFEFYP